MTSLENQQFIAQKEAAKKKALEVKEQRRIVREEKAKATKAKKAAPQKGKSGRGIRS